MHIPQGSLHMICECFFGKIDRKLCFFPESCGAACIFSKLWNLPPRNSGGSPHKPPSYLEAPPVILMCTWGYSTYNWGIIYGCCSPTVMHLPTASVFFLNQSHYQLLVAHLDFARARCARSTAHMVSSEKRLPRNLPVDPNSSLLKP